MTSIASTGSSSNPNAALQTKLTTDQKTLKDDEAKQASQSTINGDQAKVTADQKAINQAPAKGGQSSWSGSHGGSSDADSDSAGTDSASADGNVDVLA